MSSPPLEHLLYALGQMTRHYGYRPDSLPFDISAIPYSTGEQLGMLDLLSLLLVTAGPGDVAAMSIYSRKGSAVKLYYAKNRPCTDDETTYITLLFEIATSLTIPPTIKYHTLFALVLSKCKSKIILRLRKIASTLRRLERSRCSTIQEENLPVKGASNQPAMQTDCLIRSVVGSNLFPPDLNLVTFLKKWFKQILIEFAPGRFFDYKTFNKSVFNSMNISYILAHNALAITILDTELRRPIEKLAEYIAAIKLLVNEIPKLHTSQAPGLIVKEIPSPIGSTKFVPGDFLGILNQWGAVNGHPLILSHEIKQWYRKRKARPKAREIALKLAVHAECTLGLALVNECLRSRVPTIIHVGLSKSACWMSNEFLSSFNVLYPDITVYVSSRHGKLDPAWRFPPETPSEILAIVQRRVEDELTKLATIAAHPKGCLCMKYNSKYYHDVLDEDWDKDFDLMVVG